MKRQRVDAELPRQFIQAMIVNKAFLAQSVAHLDVKLLESPHLRQVAKWCIEHYGTYSEAPGKSIEPIYYAWAEKQEEDSPDAEAIKSLLGNISEDYEASGESINVPFLIDSLAGYLTMRKVDVLKENLEEQIFTGNVDQACIEINDFRAAGFGRNSGMDPLGDSSVWKQAFAEGLDPLIEFKGAAGRFFNSALTRESLIAIQAPEKRGKTWWCIEFVLRALAQRRKVAFFQVGDLTEGQVLRRLGVRFTGRPMWRRACGDIMIPWRLFPEDDEEGGEKGRLRVEYKEKPKHCPDPITEQACIEALPKIYKRSGLDPAKTHLMVSVHPTMSASVPDLEAMLTAWEVEREFVPDVIVVDYADILRPISSNKDVRDQTNETWAALRRLSQERRALVIVPTQADAQSYDVETMGMKNFSEDKRKMAHVTGMLGLNQTEEEKTDGIMRLNWVVLRESPFFTSQCLSVAQCLTLGRAMCCTYMKGDENEG